MSFTCSSRDRSMCLPVLVVADLPGQIVENSLSLGWWNDSDLWVSFVSQPELRSTGASTLLSLTGSYGSSRSEVTLYVNTCSSCVYETDHISSTSSSSVHMAAANPLCTTQKLLRISLEELWRTSLEEHCLERLPQISASCVHKCQGLKSS